MAQNNQDIAVQTAVQMALDDADKPAATPADTVVPAAPSSQTASITPAPIAAAVPAISTAAPELEAAPAAAPGAQTPEEAAAVLKVMELTKQLAEAAKGLPKTTESGQPSTLDSSVDEIKQAVKDAGVDINPPAVAPSAPENVIQPISTLDVNKVQKTAPAREAGVAV